MENEPKEDTKIRKVRSENKENFISNAKTGHGKVVGKHKCFQERTMLNNKDLNIGVAVASNVNDAEVLKPHDTNSNNHKQGNLRDSLNQAHDRTPDPAETSLVRKEVPQSYVEAIKQLNTLQSNIKALKESKVRRSSAETREVQVNQVLQYLGHLNVTLDDIKKLNVIHISGTKGKGSTSAYTESILRSHGFTTGFFSSPHLIEVRERIKLNGHPISYDTFTHYFWTVYNALHAKRSHPNDMPAYFKFLTVMSYYMFVKEKPDVCVVEVGIGGLYDNTNIVPNTAVVGITSLGYDHLSVLGNTIEEIAAQKAGIMKPDCMAVTAVGQRDPCKRVLLDKANAVNCVLLEAPSILHYNWRGQEVEDDWKNTIQSINISLAIQLAYLWMFKMNKSAELKAVIDKFLADMRHSHTASPHKHEASTSLPVAPHFDIDPKTYRGIKECVWPGRIQVVHKNHFTYFLDGAHTSDSIELCSQWFQRKSEAEAKASLRGSQSPEANTKHIQRILVFNVTGERDSGTLLPPLLKSNSFDYILVTPNVLSNSSTPDLQYGGNRTVDRYGVDINEKNSLSRKPDTTNHKSSDAMAGHATDSASQTRLGPDSTDSIRANTWLGSVDSMNLTNTHTDKMSGVEKIASVARSMTSDRCKVVAFTNVLDTYNFKYSLDPNKKYHVLVTGSLHLVGAFLNVLSNYD